MSTAQHPPNVPFANREALRIRIMVGSKIQLTEDDEVHVYLRDISDTGFMAEGRDMPIGSDVSLLLPGSGWTPATVRWSLGRRFGGRFDRPVDMARFWSAQSEAKTRSHAELMDATGACATG